MPADLHIDIISCHCLLGEGAYYSELLESVLWVDIKGHALYRMDWQSRAVTRIAMPEPICWVMDTNRGTLLAGFRRNIYELDPLTFNRQLYLSMEGEPLTNRLNDGKTDREGRVYFGTMDDTEQSQSGSLYVIENQKKLTAIDRGYTVSNGPAVNAANTHLYSNASATRTVYRFNLHAHGVSDKAVFVKFSEDMGYPDGITVDAEDHLWVAAWDGYAVMRFSPQGELVARIALPAPQITSVAFCGPARDTLVVTSATIGLTNKTLADHPHSGAVFMLKPGVKGLAETPANL
ncbi:SMP-30/gluconolactonase/LRE family protein [Alteromonas pelagimontana]|uniref:SMP-30/gluconolactonase/LRE family protein n=1 Tax=Alteromonas pelagimontana TaxID=1858656 RepID=A0A6M4MDL0_9ALTE|nr:SMP-30/gluconolactonase/LRE family protein [Alteromonas pelagimontana]QJR81271.1 SMP-30/gluconolactonase/LRE family protein [Alteromonas pelagimontana]